MTTLNQPLTLPNGQLKAALSKALGTKVNVPDHRLRRLHGTWSRRLRLDHHRQHHGRPQLDLNWHTDQFHRLGAGLAPDLDRSRNGRTSFRRKRG